MSGLGEAMMISWASFGVRIEKQRESIYSLEIYISVPEHSYILNADGEEMAGEILAKRFKTVLTDIGVKRLTVKYKVRAGESWSEKLAKDAEIQMRKTIYGSQW